MKTLKRLLAALMLLGLQGVTFGQINITVHNIGQGTAYGVKLCFNSSPSYTAANALGSGCINGGNIAAGASSGPCTPTSRPYMFCAYYTNASDAGNQQNVQFSAMTSQQTGSVTLDISPGGAAPVAKCYSVKVVNNSASTPVYLASSVDSTTPGAAFQVVPGASSTQSYSDASGAGHVIRFWYYQNYGQDTMAVYSLYTGSAGTYNTNCPSANDVILSWDGVAFTPYLPPAQAGQTNDPINWSGITNAGVALDATLRAGFSALLAKENDIWAQAHRDSSAEQGYLAAISNNTSQMDGKLTTVNSKLDTLNNTASGGLQSVTNTLGAQHALDRQYLAAISNNTSAATSTPLLQAISNSTAGLLSWQNTHWVMESNTWYQAQLIKGGIDGVNAREDTANSYLGAINSHLGNIESSSGTIQSKSMEIGNNTWSTWQEANASRTNLQSMLSKVTEMSTTLTGLLNGSAQTNLHSKEILDQLTASGVLEQSMVDGITVLKVNTQNTTNLLNQLAQLGAAISAKLGTQTNDNAEILAKLEQIRTNTIPQPPDTNWLPMVLSMTNALAGFWSNTPTYLNSNYVNVVLTNDISISNYVAITNIMPSGETNLNLSGIVTNKDQAEGIVRSTWGVAAIEAARDALAGITQSISAPSDYDMTITIAGHTLDCNPVHKLPWAFALFRAGILFLCTLGFVNLLWKLYHAAVVTMAATDGGGIPDATVLGTNVAGVSIYLVVITVVLAAWGAVLVVLGAQIASAVTAFVAQGNFWNSASVPAMGLYLLNSALPVNAMFGFVIAGIAFKYTVTTMMLVAAGICKLLPTK